jgi:hypothetical protein
MAEAAMLAPTAIGAPLRSKAPWLGRLLINTEPSSWFSGSSKRKSLTVKV